MTAINHKVRQPWLDEGLNFIVIGQLAAAMMR